MRERINVDWSKTPLLGATELLLEKFPVEKGKPLDLSHVVLVTSTNTGGRRLRESLALEILERGGTGLFPPELWTPSHFIRPAASENLASDMQCVALWIQVLESVRLESFSALFPKLPEHRGFDWSMMQGQEIHGLRKVLVQGGHTFASVVEMDCGLEYEQNRWKDLQKLEEIWIREIQGNGLIDPIQQQHEMARNPKVPNGIKEVYLLGTTDLARIVEQTLENWTLQGVRVSVVTFGPESAKEDLFDDWGRTTECWSTYAIGLRKEQLHLCLDEEQEAEEIGGKLSQAGELNGTGLCVADANLLPMMESVCKERQLKTYLPEGIPASRHALLDMLRTVWRLMQRMDFHDVEHLLRFNLISDWNSREFAVQRRTLFEQLDKLRQERFPETLEALLENEKFLSDKELVLIPGLKNLRDRITQLKTGRFSEQITHFLGDLYTEVEISDSLEKSILSHLANAIRGGIAELDALSTKGQTLGAVQQFGLLLDKLSGENVPLPHDAKALELQGWLEALWEPAEDLVLAGAQEGIVPSSILQDAFLPNTLREKLGLMTNEDRHQRDAWQLATLQASRKQSGSLEIYLAKFKASGEPTLPSRILLQGLREELPERVEYLFGDVEDQRSRSAWECPEGLRLRPQVPDLQKMSVTAFSSYLKSPLLFVLGRNAEDLDPKKSEMDAANFGSLLHKVLERFARGETAHSEDETVIRDTLQKELRNLCLQRFGSSPSLAIRTQMKVAEERLNLAARQQAEHARKGWRIIDAEKRIHSEVDASGNPLLQILALDSTKSQQQWIPIHGMIDRIDFNQDRNQYCVIDYKTSDKGSTPFQTHLKKSRRLLEILPDYAKVEVEGKEHGWQDLQLPLYSLWNRCRHPHAEVFPAYFNLPSTPDKAGIQMFEELGEDLIESARTCAEGVLGEILYHPEATMELRKKSLAPFEEAFRRLIFHAPKETLAGV